MKNVKYVVLFILTLVLTACSKEESYTDLETSKLKFSIDPRRTVSIVFKAKFNRALKKDVEAHIDPLKKVITAIVPEGTNVTSLTPSILPAGTQYSPTGPQDFSRPVKYTFNLNRKTYGYIVQVQIGYTDRDVLIAIHRANPGNTLGWADNLTDPDLNNWEGVETDTEGNVTTLWISNSKLNKLPPEIGGLENLERLSVSQNSIQIPKEIGKLQNLELLFADDCNLKGLPSEITSLLNLRWIRLTDNGFHQIPSEIFQLGELKMLNLGYNNLTSIPEQILDLNQLESLELYFNDFDSFPLMVTQLTQLHGLDLSHNNLGPLPEEFFRLTNLRNLDYAGNNLEEIPDYLFEFQFLRHLGLSSNEIYELSPKVGQLTDLQSLWLGNNNLESLPDEISLLSNLSQLLVYNNGLTSIPRELGQLTQLTSLRLENNFLPIIHGSICDLELQGTTEIDIVPGVQCQY